MSGEPGSGEKKLPYLEQVLADAKKAEAERAAAANQPAQTLEQKLKAQAGNTKGFLAGIAEGAAALAAQEPGGGRRAAQQEPQQTKRSLYDRVMPQAPEAPPTHAKQTGSLSPDAPEPQWVKAARERGMPDYVRPLEEAKPTKEPASDADSTGK